MPDPTPSAPGSTELGPPDAGTVAAIAGLATDAAELDGREPFSEQTRVALQRADPAVTHVVRRDASGRVVGYGQRDAAGTAELGVDPAARRRGHGRALLDALLDAGPLHLWAHGPHPGAVALAAATGARPIRELWRMRRPLPLDAAQDPPGEIPLPPGVTVRTFVVGRDEDAWLALNAKAFAAHGEQGRLTRADLDARIAADWFDADGFFVAEHDGRMVGFHWTKEHRATATGPAAGEIYVLGVDPDTSGGGLGRSLSRIGLRHLAQRGLSSVLLYVDADNAPAVAVYRRLGFETEATSVMYGVSRS